MSIVYPSKVEDYARPSGGPCRGIHACRVMTRIVGFIMDNYETLAEEGRG